MRFQVSRDFHVATLGGNAEVLNGSFADRTSLFAERRERILAVRGMAEERVTEFAVRLQEFEALFHDAADSFFQLLMPRHAFQHGFVPFLPPLPLEPPPT